MSFNHPENALIQYSSSEMATGAHNSPKPVLDNRFIRVYYYRAPVGNVAGQRGAMIGGRGRGARGGGRGAYKTVNNGFCLFRNFRKYLILFTKKVIELRIRNPLAAAKSTRRRKQLIRRSCRRLKCKSKMRKSRSPRSSRKHETSKRRSVARRLKRLIWQIFESLIYSLSQTTCASSTWSCWTIS